MVLWNDGCYHTVSSAGYHNSLYQNEASKMEVIGNIYENPELLEVK